MPRIRPASRSGWNTSSASVFSPVPRNLTGRPVTALIESAAPPRASPSILVRTRPVSGTAPVERLGDGDGLLAGHRVDDEERLDRLDRRADLGDLGHQGVVDRQPAGGVDDDRVADLAPSGLDAAPGDVDEPAVPTGARWTGMSRPRPSVSSWSTAAGRYGSAATSSGRRPSLTTCRASLAARRRLAGPLEADEHDDRRVARRWKVRSPADRSAMSSSWTIFTTCWPAVRLVEDLGADGPLADPGDEVLDDLEVDVGLEQRQADLAHRGVDVGLADAAAAGQAGEGLAQALAEGVEHGFGGLRVGSAGRREVAAPGGARVLARRGARV